MANNAKAVDTHMAVLLSCLVSMEFVDSFEDFSIKYVDAFEGL